VSGHSLAEAILKLSDLRNTRKFLEEQIGLIQIKLIMNMESEGVDEAKADGQIARIVRPTRLIVDELSLKEALADDLWDRITQKNYDPRRAEIALEEGYLEFTTLQKYTHTQYLSPYIKISHR
jgi:hypothetical protein